jgi:hypothetical protein
MGEMGSIMMVEEMRFQEYATLKVLTEVVLI